MPWVLGGEVGKKGESPWQVGEQTKSHLRFQLKESTLKPVGPGTWFLYSGPGPERHG